MKAKDIWVGERRVTANPEPWSDARPRLLCSGFHGRAILTDDGVAMESRERDALGKEVWVSTRDWSDIGDNINLDFDPWLYDRLETDDLEALVVEDGKHAFVVPVGDYPVGRMLRSRSLGLVLRHASQTNGLKVLGDCWVLISEGKDTDDAYRVKVDLAYRLMGGDPSVSVRKVSR